MAQQQATLIDQLFRTVEEIGIPNTMSILKNAQFDKIEFDDSKVEKVVRRVAEHFNIPIYEIIFGNGRLNDRKYAIGFSAYYLRHCHDYSMEEVSQLLKKEVTLCHKYCKLILQLNDKFRSDEKYKEIKKKLDPLFPKSKK